MEKVEDSSGTASEIERLTSEGKNYLLDKDSENAIKVFRQAYNESKASLGDCYTTRTCAYNLGAAYIASGSYEAALVRLKEATPPENQRDPPSNGDLFFHLGIAYEKTNFPDKAEQSYEVAIEEFRYENNSEKSGQTFFRLGKVYQRFKTYAKAISAFEQACGRLSQLDLRADALYKLARCLRHNSSDASRRQDALVECLKICHTLEQSGDRVGDKASLLGRRCLLELGHTFTETKAHARALEAYQSAVNVSGDVSDATLGWEASEGVARAHLAAGEAHQAVEGFKKALGLLVSSRERSEGHIQGRLIDQLEEALQAQLQGGASPKAGRDHQDHSERDGRPDTGHVDYHPHRLPSSTRKVKPVVSPLLDTLKSQYHALQNNGFRLYMNGHAVGSRMEAAGGSRKTSLSPPPFPNSDEPRGHSPIPASTPTDLAQNGSQPVASTSTPVQARPPPKMYPSDLSLSSTTSTGSISSSSSSDNSSGSSSSNMGSLSPLSGSDSLSSLQSEGKESEEGAKKPSPKSKHRRKKKLLGLRHQGEDNFKTVAQGLQGYDTDSDLSLVLRRSRDPTPNASMASMASGVDLISKAHTETVTAASGDNQPSAAELNPVYEDPAVIKGASQESREGEVVYASIAKPPPALRLRTPGGTTRQPEHLNPKASSSSGTTDSSSSSSPSSSEDDSGVSNDEKENTYEEINHGTMKSLASTMPTGRAPSPPTISQPPPLPVRESTLEHMARGQREMALFEIEKSKQKGVEMKVQERTPQISSKACLIM